MCRRLFECAGMLERRSVPSTTMSGAVQDMLRETLQPWAAVKG